MTAIPRQPTLILWDIDRTLVVTGEVGREIYEIAFSEIFGEPLRELADMAGRTELAILDETLTRHRISYSENKLHDFFAVLAKAADQLCERMYTVGRRMPGAKEAIIALADNGVVQTVVTGNIKPIAATKLEVFHLAQYLDLDIGGYGSDGHTRSPLIRQAWGRAQRKYDCTFEADRVVVIGDTPFDVLAAHEVGVHSLGVATDGSTKEELMVAHADIVIPDLADTEMVVRSVYRLLRD